MFARSLYFTQDWIIGFRLDLVLIYLGFTMTQRQRLHQPWEIFHVISRSANEQEKCALCGGLGGRGLGGGGYGGGGLGRGRPWGLGVGARGGGAREWGLGSGG